MQSLNRPIPEESCWVYALRATIMSSIYLVGGGSSVGKTTACQQVSLLLRCKHIQVDEVQKGIDDPAVHQFSGNQLQWKQSAKDTLDFIATLVNHCESIA